jgi:hypothetical protein
MTRVYFSTVERAGVGKGSGEFVVLDWESKEVLHRTGVLRTKRVVADSNPRGGGRGGRGIWVEGAQVYGATCDEINVFDRDLTKTTSVSNGLLVGLHEVCQERPRHLWVASTNIDAAIEIDLETGECVRSHWPREDPRLQESLGLTALDVDKSADNRALFVGDPEIFQDPSHLHLNAVAICAGELHALFGGKGVIVNLEQGKVVVRSDLLIDSHNLAVQGDQLFTIGTKLRTVCQFDLHSGRLVRSLRISDLPWARKLEKSVTPPPWRPIRRRRQTWWGMALPLFSRGLNVRGDLVYVGLAPGSILQIDWAKSELVDWFQYSSDVRVAIHGLFVDDRAA